MVVNTALEAAEKQKMCNVVFLHGEEGKGRNWTKEAVLTANSKSVPSEACTVMAAGEPSERGEQAVTEDHAGIEDLDPRKIDEYNAVRPAEETVDIVIDTENSDKVLKIGSHLEGKQREALEDFLKKNRDIFA